MGPDSRRGSGPFDFSNDAMGKGRITKSVTWIGGGALVLGAVLLFGIFFPVIREETRYRFVTERRDTDSVRVSLDPEDSGKEDVLVPVDPEFSVVIPKIDTNVRVVGDVDPLDEAAYRRALRDGVAHARGTEYPGEPGNVFLFAHSSEDFFSAGRYDAVFYLLSKLKKGDRFFVAYRGNLYEYRVFDVKTLSSDASEYLNADSAENTVTLMTCWPPGTDMKRLLVFGVLVPAGD